MKDLKEALEKNGLQNVNTYIQSGNVIFESDEIDNKKLTEKLEKLLSQTFSYQASIVLLTKDQLKKILTDVSKAWKTNHDIRCYLAFIKAPTTSEQVTPYITRKEGVDFIAPGEGVIYMTTLMSGLTQSGFTKLIGTKIYKELTMRNYNTSQKLLALME